MTFTFAAFFNKRTRNKSIFDWILKLKLKLKQI